MGVVWRNGDLSVLETRLRNLPGIAMDAAEQIVDQTVTEGAALQRELLDAATTDYGYQRLAKGRGRTAGRNDTGRMIDSISQSTSTTSRKVEGTFGIPAELAEDYMVYQDYGTRKIKAAHATVDAFLAVREQFIRRLVRMVGR